MIKIEFSNEIKNKHYEYFNGNGITKNGYNANNIRTRLEDEKLVRNGYLPQSHYKFIDMCLSELTTIAIGNPDELKNIIEIVKDNMPDVYERIENNEDYRDKILEIFDYDGFCKSANKVANELLSLDTYDKISSELIKTWNPYTLVFMLGLRVCPYCNRQYITPLYMHRNDTKKHSEEHHKLRADLDHFYPKAKYPYLSMSLYNLVPCCKFCNSSLKGSRDISLDMPNPYKEHISSLFKFYAIANPDNKISIKIMDTRMKEFLDIFQIEALYRYHQNHVEELMIKRDIYPESYIEELWEQYGTALFSSKAHIKEIIVGYIGNQMDFNKETLSKFRYDIAEELGFV